MGKTKTEVEARIRDIRDNPRKHQHTFEGLQQCCMFGGALDTSLVQAHEEYCSLGSNAGVRCDVTSGPCSCGAWH